MRWPGRYRRRGTRPAADPPGRSVVDDLVRAGILDRSYYAAQTGQRFDGDLDAAEDFVGEGAAAGWSPHPLLDMASCPAWVTSRLGTGDVAALLRFLQRGGADRRLGPLFDARELTAELSVRQRHAGGALGLFLSSAEDASPLPGGPEITLQTARRALIEHAARLAEESTLPPGSLEPDWAMVRSRTDGRVADRLSVVVATADDWRHTVPAVASVLAADPTGDLEVVVVDHGSSPPVAARLVSEFLGQPRVHYLRVPASGPPLAAVNAGFAHTTGAAAMFLHHDALLAPGSIAALRDSFERADVLGVQPLVLHTDETIESAGTAFQAGEPPSAILAGHPAEDGDRMSDRSVAALNPTALALRASDVAAMSGFDTSWSPSLAAADLCLRLAAERPGRFSVVPQARVWHRNEHAVAPTERAQEAADQVRFLACWGHVSAEAPTPPPSVGTGLRWGIRLSSPGGPPGAKWGDTHFGESLAAALRAQGHQVVTHRRGAHETPAAALDDVVVGIRGLEAVRPLEGKINVLWVISHPDAVDPAELDGFQLVFAASGQWAEEMTQRSGRAVAPLYQATDLSRRADATTAPGTGEVAVFVGTTHRDRPRPVVEDAVAAGVRFRAFGPWAGRLPDEFVGESYVANDELMTLYRSFGLVLTDHHPDMARHGFVANRVYDAVASGARVVSDPVSGLDQFEGAAQAYHSREELAFLCSPEGRDRFPDDQEMAAIAARVAAAHSFDARAEQLTNAVAQLRPDVAGAHPRRVTT